MNNSSTKTIVLTDIHFSSEISDSPEIRGEIADSLLEYALNLDQNRPADDISIVVLSVVSRIGDDVRRMTVRLPLAP